MKTTDGLNEALSNFDASFDLMQSEAKTQANTVSDYIDDFLKMANDIIKPAFQEIIATLEQHGHSGRVEIREEPQKSAHAYLFMNFKGSKKSRSNEPHMFFIARSDREQARQIFAIHNYYMIAELEQGGTLKALESQKHSGTYVLEEITTEVVKSEANTFIKHLLSIVKASKN